jgi:hypothetical protein
MGGEQYYVQGIVPAPMTGAFLSVQGLAAGAYFNYAAPMSMSQFANTAANVTLKAGTFGEQFSGTIWFDDIKIQ